MNQVVSMLDRIAGKEPGMLPDDLGAHAPTRRPVDVAAEDPDLFADLPPQRHAAAAARARARALHVGRGAWDATTEGESSRGGYGLLVIDGLLIRRVGLGERVGAELLGPGDLLRPLEHDGEQVTLPFSPAWLMMTSVRLAVLDRRWSFAMAPFPEVGIALTARAMLRSRRLANTLAISQQPRLDARLHLLFWEMADRYGRVRRDGVYLDLPLTHEILAHLAAARRPSVSTALTRLCDAGLLERFKPGWLLHGEPPDASTWERPRGAHSEPA